MCSLTVECVLIHIRNMSLKFVFACMYDNTPEERAENTRTKEEKVKTCVLLL